MNEGAEAEQTDLWVETQRAAKQVELMPSWKFWHELYSLAAEFKLVGGKNGASRTVS